MPDRSGTRTRVKSKTNKVWVVVAVFMFAIVCVHAESLLVCAHINRPQLETTENGYLYFWSRQENAEFALLIWRIGILNGNLDTVTGRALCICIRAGAKVHCVFERMPQVLESSQRTGGVMDSTLHFRLDLEKSSTSTSLHWFSFVQESSWDHWFLGLKFLHLNRINKRMHIGHDHHNFPVCSSCLKPNGPFQLFLWKTFQYDRFGVFQQRCKFCLSVHTVFPRNTESVSGPSWIVASSLTYGFCYCFPVSVCVYLYPSCMFPSLLHTHWVRMENVQLMEKQSCISFILDYSITCFEVLCESELSENALRPGSADAPRRSSTSWCFVET